MHVINFSHPLTETQRAAIERLSGVPIEHVSEVAAHFGQEASFLEQTRALVDRVGWTSRDWQTRSFLLRLPSLDMIAALVIVELHGRSGYFPTVVRLRPVSGPVRGEFEVAELIALQAVRDEARQGRAS